MGESQWLYTRPKGVRYVDMCIWVDEKIREGSVEENKDKIYEYVWLLSNMLLCKAKYFTSFNDYNDCSSFVAESAYYRLTDKSKPPLKSILNYLKSILYFRKCAYSNKEYAEVIDQEKFELKFNGDLFKENTKRNLEEFNHVLVSDEIEDLIKSMPKLIKENIPYSYKSNKSLYENIYISSLLTTLNFLVLPNKDSQFLSEKIKKSPLFNDAEYFKRHKSTDAILWHLNKSMSGVIEIIVNRSLLEFTNSVKEIISESTLDDSLYSAVLSAGFYGDESDE